MAARAALQPRYDDTKVPPAGPLTDYHDVHTSLDELVLVTRVLVLTALEAAT
jgi:hypothetical protein